MRVLYENIFVMIMYRDGLATVDNPNI